MSTCLTHAWLGGGRWRRWSRGAATAVAVGGAVAGCGTQASGRPSEQQLAAANYRELTPQRSRRLFRYARDMRACMAKRIAIGPPRPSRTRIVMAVREATAPVAVARLEIGCAASVGDPPPQSSLQARPGQVVLYLPKYCILDRKVAAAS